MGRIFICHSSRDKERFVRRLAGDLASRGHDVWYDDWSIRPGDGLAEKVQSGIEGCDQFVIVLSHYALRSHWVKQELNSALVREIEKKTTMVIPLVIGAVPDTDMPVSLRSKRYVDFRRLNERKYREEFEFLLTALGPPSKTREIRIPIFDCKKCHPGELGDDDKFKSISWMYLILLENSVWQEWEYNANLQTADLFYVTDEARSAPMRIALDPGDVAGLERYDGATLGWVFYSRDKGDGLIKIQYGADESDGIVALYWVNHVMESYLKTRLSEFLDDWEE